MTRANPFSSCAYLLGVVPWTMSPPGSVMKTPPWPDSGTTVPAAGIAKPTSLGVPSFGGKTIVSLVACPDAVVMTAEALRRR